MLDVAFAYARFADRIDAPSLGELFVEDGILRIQRPGDVAAVERIGRDAIVAAIRGLERYDRTFHMIGNHYYDVDGEVATGEVYCIAHHVHGEAGSKVDHVMMIRYQDQYRRTADGWRVVVRELSVDWTEERSVTSS